MDNEQLLKTLLEHFNDGFDRVHIRLDAINKVCADRQASCATKFSEIKTCIQVNEAIAEEGDKHNYMPIIIKSAIVFLTGSGLALVWKVALHIGG